MTKNSTSQNSKPSESIQAETPIDEQAQSHTTNDNAVAPEISGSFEAPKVQEMEEKMLELEKKAADSNDKYLRLFSEFDNYRKRTARERIDLIKTASEDLIICILPILDDMERAISLIANTQEATQEGIVLIYNKLKTILQQKGLEESGKSGDLFDVDIHEAVTHIPASTEDQKGKVVEVLQKGYSINGKIIRFAKVVVGN